MGNSPKYKINDFSILSVAFVYLFAILFSNRSIFNMGLVVLAFLNILIIGKLHWKYLLYIFLLLILPLISVFITTIIYYNDIGKSELITITKHIVFTQNALNTALYLVSRTFSLTFISFCFVFAIRFDKLIFSMMQNLKLPVSIGYSLLAAVNAFINIKSDFFRIRTAYKMRLLKKKSPFLLLIPLLVGASRYAYYAGLSLESRGLKNNKTYLNLFRITFFDVFYFGINLGAIIAFNILIQ